MSLYLILLLTDLWLWYALITDLKERNRILRAVVITVKASISLTLLFVIISVAGHRGEFAEPANAFNRIVLGALAAMLLTAGTVYTAMALLTWIPARLMRRKMRVAGLINITLFLLIVLLFADSYFRQRFDVRVVREEVAVPGLSPALSGMKIVLISDLHLSSWHRNYDKLEKVMTAINREEPDLLVNTGDFITYGWQEFGECDTILRKATAKIGAFAVVGNHDDGSYHPDYDESYRVECRTMIETKVSESGYQLLSDTAVTISRNGTEFAVAGVVTHGHRLEMRYGDFEKVLGPVPDSLFTLMLLHDPAGWLLTSVNGHMPQLTVSGHTHGMQAATPGGRHSPAQRYHERWRGTYKLDGSQLFVTTGLGTMGMALRLFMPPEIVVLTVIPE